MTTATRAARPSGGLVRALFQGPERREKLAQSADGVIKLVRSRMSPKDATATLLYALAKTIETQAMTEGEQVTVAAGLRGMLRRAELLEARGGHCSSQEAASLLHISKPSILSRYRKGGVLGVQTTSQNAVIFPRWQFDAQRGRVHDGVSRVLAALANQPALDDWAKLVFFLSPRDSLGGKAPLDLATSGVEKEVQRAVNLALAYGE